MKKFFSLITAIIIIVTAVFLTGCEKTTGLSEDYNTPNMNFKGLNFECVSDGDKATIVRNNMVYGDLSDFIIEDLNSKGNKITSIDISESSGEVFHENQTVAVFIADIKAESGDIQSGQYYLSAYFTYDLSDEANTKMYLINYCFVPEYKVDSSLFNESYNKIKDKL